MTLLRDESKNSGLDFFLSSDGVGAESGVCMYLFVRINVFREKTDILKVGMRAIYVGLW